MLYLNMSDTKDIQYDNDIVALANDMNFLYVDEIKPENISLVDYISQQNIDEKIKQTVIEMIYNDNYDDYISIYNICLENDIQLPPL
jgi:hypothetical protein